jgi:hypothetical protein
MHLTSIDLESTENLLDREVHNCWILFHKECVFRESLKQTKLCKSAFTLPFTLQQWLPTLFQMWTPLAANFQNCTLHISKMFVINTAAVTSNVYVVTLK